MLTSSSCGLLALLLSTTFASPLAANVALPKTSFCVDQRYIGSKLKNAPADMARAVAKYASAAGVTTTTTAVPLNVLAAAAAIQSGSVTAIPEAYDSLYLSPVQVGQDTLMLDFDTGSSDLWAFSTLTSTSQAGSHTLYDTSTGVATNQTWKISYGDGSGASGKVYADKVVLGSVTATSMAVEAATSVASSFVSDENTDGLLGLGFGNLNTCSPSKCNTFFDTVKSTLASALFTVTLKKAAPGSYDFGFIDSSKYTGAITYAAVTSSPGYWTFTASGYAVGSGPVNATILSTIADTGTSLMYMPSAVLTNYYAKVAGAVLSSSAGGYIFPCDSVLPDLTFVINGYSAVVPGSYLNYAPNGDGTCYGGLQSSASIGLNILGDIFFKSQFVVFDQTQSSPRLGFAPQVGVFTATSSSSSVVASATPTSSSVATPTSTSILVTSTTTSASIRTSTSTTIVKSTPTSTPTSTPASSTTSTVASPSSTALSCPSSNGTTYTANGASYLVECFTDHLGGDLSSTRTSTLDACITTCSTTTGCIAVSWVPGAPGFCYMHSTLTAASTNNGVWGAVLTSSAVVTSSSVSKTPSPSSTLATVTTSTSPSATATSTPSILACPANNGTKITSGAASFQVQCFVDHAGGDFKSSQTATLNDCITTCAGASGCVALSWVPGSAGLGWCYLKNVMTNGVATSNVWGAVVV